MSPETVRRLCLRFYGHRTWHGTWKAVCVDLDLSVERASREEAIQAIQQQVYAYIKAVLDTNDRDSWSYLLHRPAPLRDHIAFRLISMLRWPHIIARWLLVLVESFEKCLFVPEYTHAV